MVDSGRDILGFGLTEGENQVFKMQFVEQQVCSFDINCIKLISNQQVFEMHLYLHFLFLKTFLC